MEANIEEPMTLDELSHHVDLSRRQLERLFQRYLNCVPTRYYLELRLERARQLLLQTSKPIVDIALACGFVSAPHFSKCYRDTFSVPPRDERRRAAGLLDDVALEARSGSAASKNGCTSVKKGSVQTAKSEASSSDDTDKQTATKNGRTGKAGSRLSVGSGSRVSPLRRTTHPSIANSNVQSNATVASDL